jgi:hypothetical protein
MGVTVILVILVGIAYGFWAGIVFGARAGSPVPTTARAAVVAALGLGVILRYVLRKSAGQFFYGLIQLAFGLVAAWLAPEIARMPAIPVSQGGRAWPFALIAVLGSAFYLVSHGIDNLAEGISQSLGVSAQKGENPGPS